MDDNVVPFRDPEPRSDIFTHRGIRAKITFNVQKHEWHWMFSHTVTLTHTGTARSLPEARKACVNKIEAVLP